MCLITAEESHCTISEVNWSNPKGGGGNPDRERDFVNDVHINQSDRAQGEHSEIEVVKPPRVQDFLHDLNGSSRSRHIF